MIGLALLACSRDGDGEPGDPEVTEPEPWSIQPFDEVVFYDGYAALVDEPVPDGVLRLRNDLVTRRLDDADLERLLDTLRVDVTVGARCDNYDRIANVSVAFVPEGAETYDPNAVPRLEVGRFITPFMDLNETPRNVPYTFDATPLIPRLADPDLRAEVDLWLELEIFGVPYAANEEVAGCAGRTDVFAGSVTLTSEPAETPAPTWDQHQVLAFKVPFNDYQAGAGDALGETRRTFAYTLDGAVKDAVGMLIVSNHGANAGGEEYVRREHVVRADGAEVLRFVPGRETCEPFRRYNTQPNGIYGPRRRTPEEWQSFSNWCPGDRIDTRPLALGALDAGEHTLQIEVPDAEFADDQGDFPLSLWILARSE